VRQFSVISLVDAAGVNPKVVQTILYSLFSTKKDFLVTRLALASAIYYVLEGNFLVVRSPCVRKYSVRRDFIVTNQCLGKGEFAGLAL